jgi:hypothetical protein
VNDSGFSWLLKQPLQGERFMVFTPLPTEIKFEYLESPTQTNGSKDASVNHALTHVAQTVTKTLHMFILPKLMAATTLKQFQFEQSSQNIDGLCLLNRCLPANYRCYN